MSKISPNHDSQFTLAANVFSVFLKCRECNKYKNNTISLIMDVDQKCKDEWRNMKFVPTIPLDLWYFIQEYEGSIKMRNGKYMGQIPTNDKRYRLLKNIVEMQVHYSNALPHGYYKYIKFSNNCSLQIRYSEYFESYLYTYYCYNGHVMLPLDEYFWT